MMPLRGLVMGKVKIELENCYGIRKLQYDFNFLQKRVYAIYAPNGAMKTSLAQTFKDMADGVDSRDRIFSSRVNVRKITDENGHALPKESVLVLPPYDEFFGHTEKTSTLLVNNKLRKEFEKLNADLEHSKEVFLDAMKTQSHSRKKGLDKEIASAIMYIDTEEAFYQALDRVKNEVAEQKDAPFSQIEYDAIFDEKVLAALGAKDVATAINAYITKYNELLAASTYFKGGIFEYYNASQIAKALADNGFFAAKHTITLNASKKLEISTPKQLEDVVAKELDNITNDKDFKKTFAELKKLLERNVTVRDFHKYLCDHELLLPHLANIDFFKVQIWKSYFKANEGLYNDLLDKYRKVKERRKEIQDTALKEHTLWEAAIDLFNDRFFVPFTLEATNKAAVVLDNDAILDLGYTFKDENDSAPVVKDTLMKSLSQGEKKALYILNIIFEVEVRRHEKTETIFIVDDIADSFDYRNKYAIVQYLKDISEDPLFKQIIMTHNFDFFRTLESRGVANYGCCLMAARNDDGTIALEKAAGIRNVFLNDLKDNFFVDEIKKVACIPFIRNILELTKNIQDPQYIKLTSLLHWKSDSATITEDDLDTIYRSVFAAVGPTSSNGTRLMVDMIDDQAKACLTAPAGVNFENKIVLSIAIRLASEKFMVGKINDNNFVNAITAHQTSVLVDRFKQAFPAETASIELLESVALMTPENIHLNSFMYEPIVDMSDEHLRKLYKNVLNLQ